MHYSKDALERATIHLKKQLYFMPSTKEDKLQMDLKPKVF
jgi:hypothetical protein